MEITNNENNCVFDWNGRIYIVVYDEFKKKLYIVVSKKWISIDKPELRFEPLY